ncbi:MAG: hypothetical protein AAGC72_11230 [Planctomycetota bacterium]
MKPTTRRRRSAVGAVMAETVLVMPFIMIAIMLIIYLGWNFRRLAQVTNMDRYEVWSEVTPTPDTYRVEGGQLNTAFFGLNGDQAQTLNGLSDNAGYLPEAHREVRDQQTDETYAYFDEFLGRSPTGLQQRFRATHSQSVNTELLGLSDVTRNGDGHSRLDGDWRYAREVFDDDGTWFYGTGELDRRPPRSASEPDGDPRPPIIDDDPSDNRELSYYHVSLALSLREVFFVRLDDGLSPYENSGNQLARNIREFYLAYPEYRGPDINNPAPNTRPDFGQDDGDGGPSGVR